MKRYTNESQNTALKIAVYILLLVLLTVLQTTLMPRLTYRGVMPDIVLSAILTIAVYFGENAGALFGVCIGFVLESVGGSGLSVLPLFYLATGYIGGRVGANARASARFAAWCISLPLFVLAKNVFTFLYYVIRYTHHVVYSQLLVGIILPEFIYTCLTALPVFAVIRLMLLPFIKTKMKGRT